MSGLHTVPASDWDLVVVGGGRCGLAGANGAAQCGARVRLLEKAPRLGGNVARSTGSMSGAGTRFQEAGIADSADIFFDDLRRRMEGRGDQATMRSMCELSARLVHWLVYEVGADLPLTMDYRHVAHSVNRLHNPPSREGAELIASLESKARAIGVTIELNAPVLEIVTHAASVELNDGPDDAPGSWISGRSVLLATDGFGGAHYPMEDNGGAARLDYFGADDFAVYPGTAFRGPFERVDQAIASPAFAVAASFVLGRLMYEDHQRNLDDPEVLRVLDLVRIEGRVDLNYLDAEIPVDTADRGLARQSRSQPPTLFQREWASAAELFARSCVDAGLSDPVTYLTRARQWAQDAEPTLELSILIEALASPSAARDPARIDPVVGGSRLCRPQPRRPVSRITGCSSAAHGPRPRVGAHECR